MSDVKIRKAKIKDDLFLEVEFTEELPGHSKKETKLTCTVPVHDDMKESFQKLHTHLAILCDEVTLPKKTAFEEFAFPGFDVRGFTISGTEDKEGVTISGSKEGKYGSVNLNTPFTKYEDEKKGYPYTNELSQDVEACLFEINEYLFNGKRAPEVQLEMAFDGESNDQDNEEKETE